LLSTNRGALAATKLGDGSSNANDGSSVSVPSNNEATGGFKMNLEVFPGLVPVDTVLVHGNVASNNWWKPAVDVWRRRAEGSAFAGRLILGEWRGCGQSTAPSSIDELRPWNLALDYVSALARLKVQRCSFIGHSMGGLIGLYALLQKPELFERAVLLDPVGPSGLQIEPAVFERFTAISRDRALLATVLSATIRGCDVSSPFFQSLVDDAFGIAPLNWHGVLKALSGIDLGSELERIRQPILVLHGAHDPVLPLAESKRLAERLPRGTFCEIKNGGHSANVETPELFVELASEFLYGRA
jgi:pimeloyl-ACP methyl ester carboxylesterase